MSDDAFKTLCVHGDGEKCDLHFVVENSIMENKNRIKRLEASSKQSFDELNKSLNDFTLEVRTYMNTQQYRDKDAESMRTMTRSNSDDIHEMKVSLKSVIDNHEKVNKSVEKINENVQSLTDTVKELDRSVLGKKEVSEVVEGVMMKENLAGKNKWFESLPAKISAGVALISFIAFFTIKIVVLLLSV